jgi:hypothetical protein
MTWTPLGVGNRNVVKTRLVGNPGGKASKRRQAGTRRSDAKMWENDLRYMGVGRWRLKASVREEWAATVRGQVPAPTVM